MTKIPLPRLRRWLASLFSSLGVRSAIPLRCAPRDLLQHRPVRLHNPFHGSCRIVILDLSILPKYAATAADPENSGTRPYKLLASSEGLSPGSQMGRRRSSLEAFLILGNGRANTSRFCTSWPLRNRFSLVCSHLPLFSPAPVIAH